jgi:hypothetical protein
MDRKLINSKLLNINKDLAPKKIKRFSKSAVLNMLQNIYIKNIYVFFCQFLTFCQMQREWKKRVWYSISSNLEV